MNYLLAGELFTKINHEPIDLHLLPVDQTSLFLMYSKNTFRQGVCNGGSHVETSSICAVPLGIV